MKAISPLVASVLLIAITVAVSGLVGLWFTSFTRTSTGTVSREAEMQIACNSASMSFSNVCYDSQSKQLKGYITNTGIVNLGNISLQLIYDNTTSKLFYLYYAGGDVIASETCCGNLTMRPQEMFPFSIPSDSNYYILRVISNCTTTGTDNVYSYDISSC